MTQDILIVGSGMAGLACARRLAEAGLAPVILDKGRGVGGRMSTRRATVDGEAIQFDHGAQFFTAREAGFRAMLDACPDAVGAWQDGAEEAHFVGLPGMSGLPKRLAQGRDLRQGVTVTGVSRVGRDWLVETSTGQMTARRVILTVPAPQVAPILGADHALVPRLDPVEMAPCLTLMAAFPKGSPTPFVSRRIENGPLAWIAQDSSKPARPGAAVTWVAQATPDWSHAHIDAEKPHIAALLLPHLAEAIGVPAASALHVAGHRWRYARVTTPLGHPFLAEPEAGLYLGGDWCLGARVEAAWRSGVAIAEDLLARHDAR